MLLASPGALQGGSGQLELKAVFDQELVGSLSCISRGVSHVLARPSSFLCRKVIPATQFGYHTRLISWLNYSSLSCGLGLSTLGNRLNEKHTVPLDRLGSSLPK